jgi:tetratricopeptide (TPR) repeat protein
MSYTVLRKILLLCLLTLGATAALVAQENRLAEQYFQNGEYQKAGQLYLRLYQQQPVITHYFGRYIECLTALKAYDEAEEALRKEIKKSPQAVSHYVALGDLLRLRDRQDEADKAYRQAIKEMPNDYREISNLARAFTSGFNYELAEEAYRKGARLLKDPDVFASQLADLYRSLGNYPRMIEQYLIVLRQDNRRLSQVQMIFNRFLPDAEMVELQTQLYEQINRYPDDTGQIELLAWSFSQQKDYKNALRQLRALDKRLQENGLRVYRLGLEALNERDFEAAIDAFGYIVRDLGNPGPYYYDSKKQLLFARRQAILDKPSATREDFVQLESEYLYFIEQEGIKPMMAPMLLELADLQARYLHDLDKSIALLEEVVDLRGIKPDVLAQAKLQLGDAYLMRGDVWDATLLYSQVDKQFKDDPIGHEARFRNARLSYFNEDFDWAHTQFKVLKASTSKLIANDAMDMSVFIMDNFNLDTTHEAMGFFAQAELLIFQNRHQEALLKLDTLTARFPFHSLEDDVYYLKARIYVSERDYERAATLLNRIVDEFPEDIWADNALFKLGELYEGPLRNIDKAMAYYERIFTDYSGSTFAVDARKNFRRLRGDAVQ